MNLKKLGMVYAISAAISSKNYMLSKEDCTAQTYDEIIEIYKQKNTKNHLYHYCPMDALQSIIKNQQIRFTNIGALNDQTEFFHAIELLKEVLVEKRTLFSKELYDFLNDEIIIKKFNEHQQNYLIKGLDNLGDGIHHLNYQETLCNVYTCSFSEKHDLEYMWNHYADSRRGACIEFLTLNNHIIKEKNESKNYKMIYLWSRILYDDKEKKAKIFELLEDVQKMYQLCENSDLDSATRQNFVQSALVSGMNNLRVFMKKKEDANKKYYLEKEYRGVVIIPDYSIKSDELPLNYTGGNNYVDIPFQPEAIKRIQIGRETKGGYEQWRKCMEEELERHGMGQVKIYKY